VSDGTLCVQLMQWLNKAVNFDTFIYMKISNSISMMMIISFSNIALIYFSKKKTCGVLHFLQGRLLFNGIFVIDFVLFSISKLVYKKDILRFSISG